MLLAAPRGFCAGVERAIMAVERALADQPPPVYVRKEIVHNRRVIQDLERRGVIFVDSEQDVPEGATCLFSAHGVAPSVRVNATRRRLRVIDATCPLVTKVHREAIRFAEAKRQILLIGHRDHEEVQGTAGEAPERTIVVQSIDEVRALGLARATKVAVVTQTTLSIDDTREIVDHIVASFDDVALPRTLDICYATQHRQDAVKEIALRSDVVLILGSTNSSNSQRLVEVARRAGAVASLIEDAGALDEAFLRGAESVGVSAGASAPPELVTELLAALERLGFAEIETVETSREDITFTIPTDTSPARVNAAAR